MRYGQSSNVLVGGIGKDGDPGAGPVGLLKTIDDVFPLVHVDDFLVLGKPAAAGVQELGEEYQLPDFFR